MSIYCFRGSRTHEKFIEAVSNMIFIHKKQFICGYLIPNKMFRQ